MRAMVLLPLLGVIGLCAPSPTSSASTAAEATDQVAFVADAAVARNTSSPWIVLPDSVQPGDRLVLIVSMNSSDRQVSDPTGVGGWTPEGNQAARSMRTLAWSRVAGSGDAGSRVDIGLSARAKSTVHVAAYRGVDAGPLTVASKAETNSSTTRATPLAPAPAGAWAVSYWASKSSSTTSWAPPDAVTARRSAANSGSGRIVSLLADSGAPVPSGDYGNLAARSDAGSNQATTWTVVLPSTSSGEPPPPSVAEVRPDAETDPVSHSGDAADDPAVWVHPTARGSSLVIGNDKQGALEVYDLDGARLQTITTATSFWGNVDVRQGVTIGGQRLDVVVAYNAGLRTFTVDPATRRLEPVGDGTGSIPTRGGEGLCAYHSARTGNFSVFVITRGGRVRQYEIHDGDGDGLLQGTLRREFFVGSEAEGCVADDATGRLYVSEEDVGLWRYGAEPGDGTSRTQVDAVKPDGNLAYDVEGVTLAETGSGTGYLLVSAQNGAQPSQSYFAVYDRQSNDYLWSFRVASGTEADGCERTDGIAVYAGGLGSRFPSGVFVCQDNGNTAPAAGNQNFKLTEFDKILPGG